MTKDQADDVTAIRDVIARQFASLSWNSERAGDWSGFARDFLPGATLLPALRPVAPRSVAEFVARMQALSAGALQSLEEQLLGVEVIAFGNVAVAAAACKMVENGQEAGESVEMLLLVKDEGQWRIAAQAWDKASDTNPARLARSVPSD